MTSMNPAVIARLLGLANAARRQHRLDAAAESTLELAFGCSRRLAVYGTLAPGQENHHQLASCPGRWSAGRVHGHLALRDYPVLRPDPDGPPVPVQVLVSTALAAHWPALDAFEGDGYRRLLVTVFVDEEPTIANLYAAAD